MNNNPDLVVLLDGTGAFAGIASTLPLRYQTATLGPGIDEKGVAKGAFELSKEIYPEVFLGSYPQILRHLKLTEPSKDFDAELVFQLCRENQMLKTAFDKYGVKEARDPNGLIAPVVKILRTLYNAFIVADQRLMDQYLKLQK